MSQTRLYKLKKLLADEKASDNPCQTYIDDLELSISDLEPWVARTEGKGFELVKGTANG